MRPGKPDRRVDKHPSHTPDRRITEARDRRAPQPDRKAEQSRALWAAAAVAMLGVVQASSDVLKPLLDDRSFGLILIGVGVLMAGLRVITTQSIGRRK
jgi:hypothetical protein